MTELPATWAQLMAYLAAVYGGGGEGHATATAFVREAVHARWGVWSLHDLHRYQRGVAFQRTAGAWLDLTDRLRADGGDPAFRTDLRALSIEAFSRRFDGHAIEGPPWRLGPDEDDRPAYGAWKASAALL